MEEKIEKHIYTKEVVWVFGQSASGKETFIRKIQNDPTDYLLKVFGWGGKTISICEDSLNLIGQKEDDPIDNEREVILKRVPELLENADVVLIKGQDSDLKEGRPRRLSILNKNAKQRILFISIEAKDAFARWRNKSWWKEGMTINDAREWESEQLSLLAGLKDFEILRFHDGPKGDFKQIILE